MSRRARRSRECRSARLRSEWSLHRRHQAAVPFKSALFFCLLCRFRLRARSAFLASLSLSNYSEFGLIVATLGYKEGWITSEWLIILAIAVAITFIAASPLNPAAHSLWARFGPRLKRFETETRLPEDEPLDPGEAEVVVVGMAPMGERAFDVLRWELGDKVVGLDRDPETVAAQRDAGRRVLLGDSTDPDFYERIEERGRARLVLLTMPNVEEKLTTVRLLRPVGPAIVLAALAQHEDEVAELRDAGIQVAVDLSSRAGEGLARHAMAVAGMASPEPPDPGP